MIRYEMNEGRRKESKEQAAMQIILPPERNRYLLVAIKSRRGIAAPW